MADSRKLDRHVECPRCNYRYHYHCTDGRRKCKRCGKLFTHRRQRRGVGAKRLKEIARLCVMEAVFGGLMGRPWVLVRTVLPAPARAG